MQRVRSDEDSFPEGHSAHFAAPTLFMYKPPSHNVQLAEPELFAYLPVPHAAHTVAEAPEYSPLGQAPVTSERPVVLQKEPARHSIHELPPEVVMKVPTGQLEQLVNDAIDEYVPGKQLEQTVDEATE